MADDNDRRYIERLRESLRAGITKVPPAYGDWSHDRAVAFKACIVRCKKLINKARATEHELNSAISLLGTFWGQ
jgi:hypothetical protein